LLLVIEDWSLLTTGVLSSELKRLFEYFEFDFEVGFEIGFFCIFKI
jgi:hypothetical protein